MSGNPGGASHYCPPRGALSGNSSSFTDHRLLSSLDELAREASPEECIARRRGERDQRLANGRGQRAPGPGTDQASRASEKGTQGRSPQPPMSCLDAPIRALGTASGHESEKDRYPEGSGPVLRSFPPRSQGAEAPSPPSKWPAGSPAGRSAGPEGSRSGRTEALRTPGNLPTAVAAGEAGGVAGSLAKTKSRGRAFKRRRSNKSLLRPS
jgi:hypothetical protein